MNIRSQYLHLILLILCGWQLLLGDVFAEDKVLNADQINQTPASLTEYFSVLEDPAQTLSLTEVQRSDIASRFTANHAPAASLNYGYTTSAYWLRFTLKNDTARLLDRMLEISYSDLSEVQFYQPLADGTYYKSVVTGFAQPFATRPYANRFFVFPVALPEHSEQVYYLRIQSNNGMVVPIRLWEPQAFHSYERKDYSIQAWYFGMVVAIAIFNLLLFFALRDVVYLMYVSYVMSLSLGIAAQNGLALELLWADTHRWSDISTTACFTLAGGFAVIFIRKMLNTRKNIPRFDRLLRTYVGISLLIPIMYAALPQTFGILNNEIFNQSLTLFDGVGVILDVGIGIYLSLKHQRSAIFFLAAFLLIAIGASISVLRDLGLLPFNTFTVNALQFGSAMEILLMALALADRFIVIRREKEKAQQQLVESLQSSERMLEERVEQRTAELQTLNEALEKAESEQRLARETSEQALVEKGRFMDMLTHELKTPISVVSLTLGHMSGQESLKCRAEHALQDMNDIVERCAQMDSLEQHKLIPHAQRCQIDHILSELRSSSAAPDRISITADSLPDLNSDQQLIHVILGNLFNNAIKYSQPETVIDIRAEAAQRSGKLGIQVMVQNQPGAAGLPDPEQVFDKYYRSSGAHRQTGSGLGLYLVRSFTQLLGGQVAYDVVQERVRFTLWIPC